MLNDAFKELNKNVHADDTLKELTKMKMHKEKRAQKAKKTWMYTAVAAAACIGVFFGAFYLIPKTENMQPQVDAPKVTESSNAGNPDDSAQFPAWFTPGKITVTALLENTGITNTSFSPYAAANMGYTENTALVRNMADSIKVGDSVSVKLPNPYRAWGNIWAGTRYVWISVFENDKHMHSGCTWLFYDTQQNDVLCLDHLAKQKLMDKGVWREGEYLYMALGNPYTRNCAVLTEDAWYACNADGSVEKLDIPAKVGEFPVVNKISADGRYGVVSYAGILGVQPKANCVWLFDLQSGDKVHAENIGKRSSVPLIGSENILFTPNGKYMLITVWKNNAMYEPSDKRTSWAAYNLEKGTLAFGEGEIVRYLKNGTAAVVQTANGCKVLDLNTGADITQNTTLTDREQRKLVQKEVNDQNRYGFSVTLEALFGQSPKNMVLKDFVSAYVELNGILYTYTHGDAYLECMDVETGASFKTAVSEDFVKQATQAGATKRVVYSLLTSADGTQVFLGYSASGSAKA